MQRRIKQAVIYVVAVLVTIGLLNLDNLAAATVPGINQQISLRSTGGLPNNSSTQGLISPNGKVAAFMSSATNVLTNPYGQGIFARNLASGAMDRVNVSTAGVVADSSTTLINISATGRYILFKSNTATNLIDGMVIPASPAIPQLYLRDRVASTTTLVSQTSTGVLSNGLNEFPDSSVSSDGRFVSFVSNATNLHPDTTDGRSHLYLLDRLNETFSLLDRDYNGAIPTSGEALSSAMSCDGSIFAFAYSGNNLLSTDALGSHNNIYILDRRGESDNLTNLTQFSADPANAAVISCNGDYIGFSSYATDIDSSMPYTGKWLRPYVYDRVNNTFHLASTTTTGVATNKHICGTVLNNQNACLKISDDGIGVFYANDPGLTGASGVQVYIRDIHAGTTEIISVNASGIVGNNTSNGRSITADGSLVVYSSVATNLVSGDTNIYTDVYSSQTGH